MTKEQKLKAIAELAGDLIPHTPTEQKVKSGSYYQWEPAYLTSHDAILPVIRKQKNAVRINIAIILWRESNIQHDDSWTNDDVISVLFESTPLQLCEALIKASGK